MGLTGRSLGKLLNFSKYLLANIHLCLELYHLTFFLKTVNKFNSKNIIVKSFSIIFQLYIEHQSKGHHASSYVFNER